MGGEGLNLLELVQVDDKPSGATCVIRLFQIKNVISSI